MGKYSSSPSWSDLTPLPTDEGGPNPLAAIAYSPDYEETMSYLRALMSIPEYSARSLQITEDLIAMNPAHYTVWLYRAKTLFEMGADLKGELEWLDGVSLRNQKNYQIWQHRNLLVDRLGKQADIPAEQSFVAKMLEKDAKNYHVWSYRQWLVKRFDLWDNSKYGELDFVEKMLRQDIRNNSAWNHRWYIINGSPTSKGVLDPDIREKEIEFAKVAIKKIPQNQSAWSYLRGIVKKAGLPLGSLKSVAEMYADLSSPEGVQSSFALDLLADIWAEEKESGKAVEALDLLKNKYDPIRKNYWEWRKGLLIAA